MNESRHGVVVVGGGLVGASLAIALSQRSVPTTLVESRLSATGNVAPERERYLALSRASVNALSALGVWSSIEPDAASIRAVHVSRRGDFGRVLLKAGDHAVDRFGAVIPASRLGVALERALSTASGLTRCVPVTLRSMQMMPGGVEARLADGEGERAITAEILVGADGAQSMVREWAGLVVELEDYRQDALVLSIGIEREHHGVAYERFTDHGAIALLPLPDRRMGLVWTLPRDMADTLSALDTTALLERVQTEFGYRLGRFHSPGHVSRHALHRAYAPEIARQRVALVGNAAQSLHPVAAQGFNLGLRDALVLTEELAAVHESASRVTFDDALRRFADRRRADRQRIASLSHALARWPKVEVPGARVLRSLGFGVLNLSSSLRNSLALTAMGFGEDTPDLALSEVA